MGEHLVIFLVGIDKAGVTGVPEQVPLAVGDIFVKRGSNNGRADITRTTANESWLSNLTQFIGILEVLKTAQRLIFIGAPAVKVGLCASTLGTSKAFG